MTILGPLTGEPPEPMTKEQFDTARKRLRATLDGVVTMDKRLIDEVIWLKRRLHRVEYAIEPLAERAVAGSRANPHGCSISSVPYHQVRISIDPANFPPVSLSRR